jgi:hypothetical protein
MTNSRRTCDAILERRNHEAAEDVQTIEQAAEPMRAERP